MPALRDSVQLDACVLLNILATGRADEVLAFLGRDCSVCQPAVAELSQLIARNPSAAVAQLPALIDSGRLQVETPTRETEERLYVEYAMLLDDASAMALALAQARGQTLATEQRRVGALWRAAGGGSDQLLSTTQILHAWSQQPGVNAEAVAEAATRVRRRAKFAPGADDPLRDWWDSLLTAARAGV